MDGSAVDTIEPSRELKNAVSARQAKTAQNRHPRSAFWAGGSTGTLSPEAVTDEFSMVMVMSLVILIWFYIG